ncbi:hypothetical protein [Kutzneria sp. NPDC052558]|uniref:hypothetical protein n=1 Tax=Kutzneria sp. NPDC052558 TaxID=3364121 RepID=UPI0037C5AC42
MTTTHIRTDHLIVTAAEREDPRLAADRLVDAIRHVVMDSPVVVNGVQGTLSNDGIATILHVENATVDNIVVPLHIAASRFRRTKAVDFIAEITRQVRFDKQNVFHAATAFGITPEAHPGKLLAASAYSYAGYISWLCLNASQSAFALLVYLDYSLAHEACAALVPALRRRPGTPPEIVSYFGLYEERPTEVLDAAIDIVRDGLAHGEDLQEAIDAVSMAEPYLGAFWRLSRG